MIHPPEVVTTAGHCCDQSKRNVQAKQKQYAAEKTVLLQLSLLNQLPW
jgi:hypothetical protein